MESCRDPTRRNEIQLNCAERRIAFRSCAIGNANHAHSPLEPRYLPVCECGAATRFDSGDPRSRSQMLKITMHPTARNSLCQFWNDSNQKRLVARYSIVV